MSIKWLIKDWKLGKFKRAKDSPQKKAAKAALRKMGQKLVRQVKANIRKKRSGALRVATAAKVWEKDDRLVLIVGAKTSFTRQYQGKEVRPARYAHLYERYAQYLSKANDPANLRQLAAEMGAEFKALLGA